MKVFIIFIFYFLFLQFHSEGQTINDSILLSEVLLRESKIETHKTGTHVDEINNSLIGQNNTATLSDFISTYSSFYIKKYGSLSTPNFRGTSSSHTLVLWNGLVINSIANGLADFSIIPINNLGKSYIVHGGSGSIFGSGAIGGSIHLDSEPIFKEKDKLSVAYELGSFGLENKSIILGQSIENLSYSLLLHTLNDENNFKYINTSIIENPEVINDYGKIESKQQQFNLSYKLKNHLILSLMYWGTETDREVIQNMTVSFSDATQCDYSDRFIIYAKKLFKNNLSLKFQQSYVKEDFNYQELSKNINSYYTAETYNSNIDLKIYNKGFLLNIGSVFSNNIMFNNNYNEDNIREEVYAIFSSIKYMSDRININSILRKEWQSEFKVPLIPTFAVDFNVNKNIDLRAKYNINFRSPTFNDRYWFSGGSVGNLDLIPESSSNIEVGLDVSFEKISAKYTIYSLNIYDMILWQPNELSIWQPINVKEVWSRGFESKLRVNLNNIYLEGGVNLSKSTNEKSNYNIDYSIGKQLRYVPLCKSNIVFSFEKDNISFLLNQIYSSKVIANYGNQNDVYLDDYYLANISLNYMMKNTPLEITLKINNIFNKSYQTYLNYPNPGREYLITFLVKK